MLLRIKLSIVFVVALGLLPVTASATAIDANISILGTTSISDGDADLATASNSYSASMYSVVGGANAAGNSTAQAITDTGDGFGHTASLSGNSTSFTALGGDYELNVNNSSATDTFKLTFGITFAHSADADVGDFDARAVSELEVEDAGGTEFLFSRLTSESGKDYFDAGNATWQDQIHDEVGDSYLGTWGDLLSFGETRYFDVNLAAGDSLDLFGLFDIDGRIWDTGASYDLTSSMFIFLDDFENLTDPTTPVPEPSSLLLLLGGLMALQLRRQR